MPETHTFVTFPDRRSAGAGAAQFLAGSLIRGQGAIALLRRDAWNDFEAALSSLGLSRATLEKEQRLVLRDATAEYLGLCSDGRLSRPKFDALVAGALGVVRGGGFTARIFGELVDVACQMGRPDDALLLETFWRETLSKDPMPLLCGYSASNIESLIRSGNFERVCDCHQAA